MKNPLGLVIATALCATACQSQTTGQAYKGKDFSFRCPKYWSYKELGPLVNIISPDNSAVFLFGATGDNDIDVVLKDYRRLAASGAWFGNGLKATLDSSPQPFVYNNWSGRAIDGRLNDFDIDVRLVAIEANGQIYILQMLAQRAIAQKGLAMLNQFARSLTFDPVATAVTPQDHPASTTECSGCFAIGMQHMMNMTSITVKGMQ